MPGHNLQEQVNEYVATTGLSLDIGGASSNDVTADTISEITSGVGVTVDGVLLKDSAVTASSGVSADTISEYTSATGVTVDGVLLKDSAVKTDTITEKTSAAGVTVDGCLIKDGRAAALATAAFFLSAELTGNGSSQDTAHSLGAAPTLVFAIPSDLTGGAFVVAYGAHDATNTKTTVTSGEKYRVIAIK